MSKASNGSKKKLPKNITEKSDDHVIEKLFGKRVLRKLQTSPGRTPRSRNPTGHYSKIVPNETLPIK